MAGGEVERSLSFLILHLEIVYITLQKKTYGIGVTGKSRLQAKQRNGIFSAKHSLTID